MVNDTLREPHDPPEPLARSCSHCAHGHPFMNNTVMRTVVTCKALPKFPVAVTVQVPTVAGKVIGALRAETVQTQSASAIQFYYATMELTDTCGLFELKIAAKTDSGSTPGTVGVG
jgi:hypothetical protein